MGCEIMKKKGVQIKKITFVLIIFTILINTNGCTAIKNTPSESKSLTSLSIDLKSSSTPFTITEEIKPQIKNEASKYKDNELIDLNKKNNLKIISGLYFLDNINFIFSSLNNNDSNYNEQTDLYKYNIKTNQLTLLCRSEEH